MAEVSKTQYNLSVTIDEVNLILGSLGKQSYEAVADVINKIRTQIIPQLAAANAPVAATPEAPTA